MTKTLSAAEVAQNFDAVLDSVAENGDEVLVEKGGRVVARLVPTPKPHRTLEEMRGSIKILGDIVSPVCDPEDWTADEDNILGADRLAKITLPSS